MFASLSSFLPAALHTASSAKEAQSTPDTSLELQSDGGGDDALEIMAPDVQGTKKKDKRDKHSNEMFIIVRPPPSKSNHPLNLQLQMVPPRVPTTAGGPASARPSAEFSITSPMQPDTPTTGETITTTQPHPTRSGSADTTLTLTRTSSNHSEASMYTGSSSVASFSSVNSTASGRRAIIPLYNLQAHNVMTNVIVDAGTDAKITKFLKRGMEIIGLAVIEPVEVWGPTSMHSQVPSQAQRDALLPSGGLDPTFLHPHGRSTSSRPVTPDGVHTPSSPSAVSLSSVSHSHQAHDYHPPVQPPDSQLTAAPSRRSNLFGKIFNRKKESSAVSPEPIRPTLPGSGSGPAGVTPTPSTIPGHVRAPSIPTAASRISRHFKRASIAGGGDDPGSPAISSPPTEITHAAEPSDVDNNNGGSTSPGSAGVVGTLAPGSMLRPTVLGIQPTMSSPVVPPIGRPGMYVWIVKKWLKGTDVGLLGGVIGKLGHGNGNGDASGARSVEVRFEWKRSRGKKKGKGREASVGKEANKRASMVGASSIAASSASSEGQGNQGQRGGNKDKEDNREHERKRSNRLSIASQKSAPSFTSEDRGSERSRERKSHRRGTNLTVDVDHPDEGEETDPEDSETPWTCTLKVRRLVPFSAASISPRTPTPGTPYTAGPTTADTTQFQPQQVEAQTVVRLKIGTLSQTPHHPKLVGMLKVPFPLPDVEVDALVVRKRVVLPGGVVVKTVEDDGDRGDPGRGLVLTAEEIKDVISSTALWLVVREGFGGVGKVSRKGDGWRIRA